jgi:hypothetical protein
MNNASLVQLFLFCEMFLSFPELIHSVSVMRGNLIFELGIKLFFLMERHVTHMLLGVNACPVELPVT